MYVNLNTEIDLDKYVEIDGESKTKRERKRKRDKDKDQYNQREVMRDDEEEEEVGINDSLVIKLSTSDSYLKPSRYLDDFEERGHEEYRKKETKIQRAERQRTRDVEIERERKNGRGREMKIRRKARLEVDEDTIVEYMHREDLYLEQGVDGERENKNENENERESVQKNQGKRKENNKNQVQHSAPYFNLNYVRFVAFCACLNSLNLGYDLGATGGVAILLQESERWTATQHELFVSSLNFFAIPGAFLAPPLCDWLGRKQAFRNSSFLFLIGLVLTLFSRNFEAAIWGRVFLGMGVGIGLSIDAMYISEVVPAQVRGCYVSYTEVSINIGIFLGTVVSYFCVNLPTGLNWQLVVGIGILFPLLIIALTFSKYFPESPRWLIMKLRYDEARQVFEYMYRRPLPLKKKVEFHDKQIPPPILENEGREDQRRVRSQGGKEGQGGDQQEQQQEGQDKQEKEKQEQKQSLELELELERQEKDYIEQLIKDIETAIHYELNAVLLQDKEENDRLIQDIEDNHRKVKNSIKKNMEGENQKQKRKEKEKVVLEMASLSISSSTKIEKGQDIVKKDWEKGNLSLVQIENQRKEQEQQQQESAQKREQRQVEQQQEQINCHEILEYYFGYAGWKKILFPTPKVRLMLLAGIGVSTVQQVNGSDSFVYYSPIILQDAGFTTKEQTFRYTMLIFLVKLVAIFLATLLADHEHVGRRKLLFLSLSIMAFSLFGMSWSYAQERIPQEAIFIFMCTFFASFSFGAGPICWLGSSEVYPTNIRAKAMSLAVIANRIACAIVASTTLTLSNAFGFSNYFLWYGCLTILSIGYVYIFFPETALKSLEEVEDLFEEWLDEWHFFGIKYCGMKTHETQQI